MNSRHWLTKLFALDSRQPSTGRNEPRQRFQPRLEQLEGRFLPAIALLHNFPDINFNQAFDGTPPDTMMAVGPNTVVGAVNAAITLTNKAGGTRVGPTAFTTFFASILSAGDRFTDPSVLYDDQAGRFYVGVIEIAPSFKNSTLDFAVSKSSSPASLTVADWTVFPKITSVNEGGTEFPDFPKMGWNNDAVFVSTNQFNFGFDHNLILAISKASILAGGPLSMQQTDVATGDERHILIPARMHHETVGNLEYFAQSTGVGFIPSTTVNVVTETGYLVGPGVFLTTPLVVNAYSNSPGVPGLTGHIDDRLLSVDWVNNGTTQRMVASGNVGVGGVNLSRWYEFRAPTVGVPSLLQQGDIDPGGDISTSYPSVAINPAGSIAMTFLENGGGQSTSMYVTGRLATDAANTMQAPLLVKSGALPIPNGLRGGDYSATEYDPSSPSHFWSANQYQFDGSQSNFHWGTQIAEYSLVTASGIWTTVAPMLTARGFLAGVTGSDGRIYAIGGFNNTSGALRTVEAYRPGPDTWSLVASMPAARYALAAAAGFNGRIYAFGGLNAAGSAVASAQAYTPTGTNWTTVASMHTARGYLAGATGSDGRIYALGGNTTNTVVGAVATVEAYNTGADTWTVVTSMHTARTGPAAATGPDGRIYVFGGMDGAGHVLNTVEAYSPFTKIWTIVAPMPTARWGAAAVIGPNGRLLVLGGSTASNSVASPTNVVESYNPNSNTWSTVTPMPIARDFLAAALGLDGRVYTYGGFDGTNYLRTVQALSSLSGFGSAAAAAKSPITASAVPILDSVTVATPTVFPILEANNPWAVQSVGEGDILLQDPADIVFAAGADMLADGLTGTLLAGALAS